MNSDDAKYLIKPTPPEISLEAILRPTRDAINAAKSLDDTEIRFVVDAYYQLQDYRKASNNQMRSIDQEVDVGTGHATLDWLALQLQTMENQIKRVLDKYVEGHVMGPFMASIYGIGPVLSAGLLAHLSINPWKCSREDTSKGTKACKPDAPCTAHCHHEKICTVGHWWRYAGLDPTVKWEKGQKRPWNAELKVLCWKAGQSFMKFSNQPECFYGRIYKDRKAFEIERNDRGNNAATAAQILLKVGKSTEAFKHLSEGKLPPGQIDSRARRYAVKLFLSHLHHEWYVATYGEQPPLPYPISQLGHAHFIEPPKH